MLYDPRWERHVVVAQPRKTWRAVLLEAAAVIELRGLHKGDFLGCDGSLCTMGAIRELTALDACTGRRAERKLAHFLKVKSVPVWNDDRYRTESEVVTALRACSEKVGS